MIERRYTNPERINISVRSISNPNEDLNAPPQPPRPEELWIFDKRVDRVKHYLIDHVEWPPSRGASQKAGGIGWKYMCRIGNATKVLYYDDANMTWFVERKEPIE